MQRIIKLCLSTTLYLLLIGPNSFAEVESVEGIDLELRQKETSLVKIINSIQQVDNELKTKQRELRGPEAEGRSEELIAEIKDKSAELKKLEQNFDAIATGVEIVPLDSEETKREVSVSKELSVLVSPLLNELKQLTSKPRAIDALKTEVLAYKEQLEQGTQAIAELDDLSVKIKNRVLLAKLEISRKEWESKIQNINTQLAIAKQRLEQKISERKPLGESLENLFRVFFKSKGKHILFATLITLLCWFVLSRLHSGIQRLSPLHKKEGAFPARVFDVLYVVVAVVGSVATFLMVLYIFGDWVLLILIVTMLLGLIWASKEAILRFWSQAALLLNMGPVRQSERIIYNGLPWKVKSLNFYTLLVNPALSGGTLRLPIQDLLDLRSRTYSSDEPWFPTQTKQWVVLSDGTYGQVVVQTPEFVKVEEKGGSIKFFTAADFFGFNPRVLSRGFRLSISFGLDYKHQSLVTKEIPEFFASRITSELNSQGYQKNISKVNVEFKEAGGSSLNLVVLADFYGDVADKYLDLGRLIQRICVDICTEKSWEIPFEQLTLHMASSSGNDGKKVNG